MRRGESRAFAPPACGLLLFCGLLLLCASSDARAQQRKADSPPPTTITTTTTAELPDKIRGYKVYKTRVDVKNAAEKSGAGAPRERPEVSVRVGEPRLTDVSAGGVTFEVSAEIGPTGQSGKINFLDFRDFRVNGLPIEVEEYADSFELKKDRIVLLPKPVRIRVGPAAAVRGALREVGRPEPRWRVTGRVFAFGRYKKYGIAFKRVAVFELDVEIKNPFREQTGPAGVLITREVVAN